MEDKWEAPAHGFATLCPESLPVSILLHCRGRKAPAAEQKGRSLLSYLLSERNRTKGQ